MNPSPDVQVCLECGYTEFIIPASWLSAGWLQTASSTASVAVTVGSLVTTA